MFGVSGSGPPHMCPHASAISVLGVQLLGNGAQLFQAEQGGAQFCGSRENVMFGETPFTFLSLSDVVVCWYGRHLLAAR